MAKYSKKRSRKGRTSRRPYKKRRNTIKGVSRKLDKLYSAIEYKHYDNTTIDIRPTQAGYAETLSGMGQGDTDLLREGDKITTTSLQLRMQIGGYAAHNLIRFVILKCRGDGISTTGQGSAATMRDRIFTNASLAGLNRPYLWKYNVDYFRSSGAKILYDSFYDLVPTSIGETSVSKTVYLKKKFPWRQNIQYQAGTTQSNHTLAMYVWGEQATDDFAPYVSFTTRLNYLDL